MREAALAAQRRSEGTSRQRDQRTCTCGTFALVRVTKRHSSTSVGLVDEGDGVGEVSSQLGANLVVELDLVELGEAQVGDNLSLEQGEARVGGWVSMEDALNL